MFGVLINSVAVIIGCGIGLLLGKAVPERVGKLVISGIGLVVIAIGFSGAMKGQNTLVLILAMVFGAVVGELLDLDGKLNRLAGYVEQRLKRDERETPIAEAFVTTTLLMCAGALAIIGPLQAGLNGDNSLIFTKTTIDFISAIIFGSTMGIGVALTGFSILLYEGFFALAGGLLAPLLSAYAIAEIACAGSVLLIGLGFNQLGMTKLKIMNLLPAVFMPMILCLIIK